MRSAFVEPYDVFDAEPDARLTSVVEILERSCPQLTFAEIERLDRRLARSGARRQRHSRLLATICLAFGLVFMTGGTGLAISGFATTGPAVQAQYPDQTTSGTSPHHSTSPGTATTRSFGGPVSRPRPPGPTPPGSPAVTSFAQLPASHSATTVAVKLTQAETRSDLPFTGFAALPVLLGGVALMISGIGLNRAARRNDQL